MTRSLLQEFWSGRKWYLAVLLYFALLIMVLYYIGGLLIPSPGGPHQTMTIVEEKQSPQISHKHRGIISKETTNLTKNMKIYNEEQETSDRKHLLRELLNGKYSDSKNIDNVQSQSDKNNLNVNTELHSNNVQSNSAKDSENVNNIGFSSDSLVKGESNHTYKLPVKTENSGDTNIAPSQTEHNQPNGVENSDQIKSSEDQTQVKTDLPVYSNIPKVTNNNQNERTDKNANLDSNRSNKTQSSIIIMCMIFTTVEQYDRKALAVKLTWAKRCDYYAFFYSKRENLKLPGAYGLDIPDGREHLTAKTMKAFNLAYSKFKDGVDWYLKADDDTYFVMENLRHLLSQYDPSKPSYIGHKSSEMLYKGYNSGGAGYVLSKAAAKLLVQKGDAFPELCHVDGAVEDYDMGRCLTAFRIFPEETRDHLKKIRFHPDNPLRLLQGHDNAYQYTVSNYTFGNAHGIKVLSEDSVSFHYLEPAHMYMYDFLLYGIKIHGRT